MKNISNLTHALGAFFAGLAITATLAAASYDKMLVFGDSLSDNGNLAAAVPGALAANNYDPFRLTDGPTTTPASLITGVTVEQLNSLLGLPVLAPALLGGNNYAWAFATTATNAPDFPNRVTPGTGTQVATYLATHPIADPNSLYVIWAGSNDLGDATTPAAVQAAEALAISNLTTQITGLLASGAKNILWFNLADLGLTPGGFLKGPAMDAQLHASSLQFRTDWNTKIQQLKSLFPTASITGVDTYGLTLNLFNNPSAYGLTNLTIPAQGQAGINPDQSLFWDLIHPTTKADSILASYAFQQLQISAVPEPSGSLYLGAALFALIVQQLYSRRQRRAIQAGT